MRIKLPEPEPRKCIVCRTEFNRRMNESFPKFNKRKFCSTKCALKYHKENRIGLFGDAGFMGGWKNKI